MGKLDTAAQSEGTTNSGLQLTLQSMAALGVTFESVEAAVATADPHAPPSYTMLSDDEWSILTPELPAEPRQRDTMGNREFVNCVLEAMRRGGRWTNRRQRSPHSDAVRRRFGRWAHQGAWTRLQIFTEQSSLCEHRKAEFKRVAQHASRLCC